MAWSEHRLSSWQEFDEQILTPTLSLSGIKHTYAFRGQSRPWTLLPSLARLCRSLNLNALQSLDIEYVLLRRFKPRLFNHMPSQPRTADVIWWWTLMQHYRAPTRILDWTFSPVVALYFAVCDDWDSDGVVWGFHRRRLMSKVYPDGIKDAAQTLGCSRADFFTTVPNDPCFFTFDRDELTERMAAQSATFTVSQDVLVDHADVLEQMCDEIEVEGNDRLLNRRKWIIDKSCKPAILKRLHVMNITAETLFPGIDGLGNELKEYVRLYST